MPTSRWTTCWQCGGSGFVWIAARNMAAELWSGGHWYRCGLCCGHGKCVTYDLEALNAH